jgi:hypothetical protein
MTNTIAAKWRGLSLLWRVCDDPWEKAKPRQPGAEAISHLLKSQFSRDGFRQTSVPFYGNPVIQNKANSPRKYCTQNAPL